VIPLNDLSRQLDELGPALRTAVDDVLRGGRYLFGPRVAEFEAQFAAYCGVRHCVSVANGTDALELALRAFGCGPGSEVITVANAGMYSSAAIIAAGARPVLADIDSVTMTMAPESFARCISVRTKAVIVTHLYGRLADIDAVLDDARTHGIAVIEDCAHAHGARRNGRMAGAWGDVGCYSFYPTKNLGALGDGGAIVTANDSLAESLRQLRQYGWTSKYHATRPQGRNSRLDELQAAVLLVKLKYVDRWNDRRRTIIERVREAAGDDIVLPDVGGMDHAAHLCVARSPQREALRSHLGADGIATDIHYPVPDHRQLALTGIFPPNLSLPATEKAAEEIVTLPCFPHMTADEVAHICDSLTRFCRAVRQKKTKVG
jgi:dTDP-3-amino-2,3,6-trideoxy-4-keto-D-glucose/dTDP-3-amino-3,4,6-trideoxy-alpha-D-glucose/dTDP-2,6-dideoxy-D-kanosamine transaminase